MNANIINLSGVGGGVYVEPGTDGHGEFMAFQALEDSVFAEDTMVNVTGLVAAEKTIPAGTMVHGLFSDVVLLSGAGIAYNRAC